MSSTDKMMFKSISSDTVFVTSCTLNYPTPDSLKTKYTAGNCYFHYVLTDKYIKIAVIQTVTFKGLTLSAGNYTFNIGSSSGSINLGVPLKRIYSTSLGVNKLTAHVLQYHTTAASHPSISFKDSSIGGSLSMSNSAAGTNIVFNYNNEATICIAAQLSQTTSNSFVIKSSDMFIIDFKEIKP